MTGPKAERERGGAGARLVSFGGLLADLVVDVESVPARGEDALARDFTQAVGGGFAVLAAAARLGMAAALAGVLGDDAIADAARAALREEGVEILFPEPRAGSSGVCLVLVDAGGERTMVTVQGVESRVQSEDFDAVAPGPGDVVYINGYELLYPHGPALVNWVRRVEPPHLVFDPGPLIAEIDPAALDALLGATSWLSLNAAEATALTGEQDPAAAAARALERLGTPVTEGGTGGVVVRTGAEGCVVAERGREPVVVQGFEAKVLDTTGAGDTHVGAFIAALAHGVDPAEACRWANAAASVVVAARGQASPPRLDQLEAILAGRS